MMGVEGLTHTEYLPTDYFFFFFFLSSFLKQQEFPSFTTAVDVIPAPDMRHDIFKWTERSIRSLCDAVPGSVLLLEVEYVLPEVSGYSLFWSAVPALNLTQGCYDGLSRTNCVSDVGGNRVEGALLAMEIHTPNLTPGLTYSFTATAYLSDSLNPLSGLDPLTIGLSTTSCAVTIPSFPSGGTCTVPAEVNAYEDFVISCGGWVDPLGGQILYQFQRPALDNDGQLFYVPFANRDLQPEITVNLPPLNATFVQVLICGTRSGACASTISLPILILPATSPYDPTAESTQIDRLLDILDDVGAGIDLMTALQSPATEAELLAFVEQIGDLLDVMLQEGGELTSDEADVLNGCILSACERVPSSTQTTLFSYLQQILTAEEYNVKLSANALDCVVTNALEGNDPIAFGDVAEEVDNIQNTFATTLACGADELLSGDTISIRGQTTSATELNDGLVIALYDDIDASEQPLFALPVGLGDDVVDWYKNQFGPATLESLYCIFIFRTKMLNQCEAEEVSLLSTIEGLTLRIFGPNDEVTEVEINELDPANPIVLSYPATLLIDSGKKIGGSDELARFALTNVNDEPTCGEVIDGCEVDTKGCVLEVVGSQYLCSCTHLSNFGYLFGTGSDGWTTYRIISFAMLLSTWFVLIIFGLLTVLSHRFRISMNVESSSERDNRVLGSA